jgi:uncharacterized repeat protein (TIGR01451 family)
VPVPGLPDLGIVKELTNNADEDGNGFVSPGDTLTYTITATNIGMIPLTGVIVDDSLTGEFTGDGSNPACPDPLAVGATCVLEVQYIVQVSDVAAGIIQNTGTADSNETPPVTDTVQVPVENPELAIIKELTNNADEDGSGTVSPGDTLTYTITATNIGSIPLTGVVVDDSLTGEFTGDGSNPPCPDPLAVGATCVLEVQYVVQESDVDTTIQNTGKADSNETPPVTDTVTVPVPPRPPTPPPTQAPTQQCIIGLDLTCIVSNSSAVNAGVSCDMLPPPNVVCTDRPLAATMLYNGGLCTQSDPNQQSGKFECEDFQGGPPTMEGAESYIVVTDAKGKGITYFEGIVGVGQNYRLYNEGERFEADQQIFIYTPAGPSMANLLQAVQYHSSCSQEFELLQRFGASQLVSFFNEEQGNVSTFEFLEFDLDIQIPITIEGEEICLETLTAITNFVGDLDLSDQVAGMCIPPGGTITVTLGATIDASMQQRYSVLATLTGFQQPSQQFCMGTDFISFVAGGLPGGPTVPPEPENLPSRLLMELPTLE